MPANVAPEELGGRSALELAELCRSLADRAERHGG
jgi:hypothetical protein